MGTVLYIITVVVWSGGALTKEEWTAILRPCGKSNSRRSRISYGRQAKYGLCGQRLHTPCRGARGKQWFVAENNQAHTLQLI